MDHFYELANAVLVRPVPTFPGGVTAAWDIKNLLTNSTNWLKTVGGLFLILLGTAALIWACVLWVKKLMANKQNDPGAPWVKIGLLFIVGGALASGGYALASSIGSGGQTTIEQLGTGGATIILQFWSTTSNTAGFLGLPGSIAGP